MSNSPKCFGRVASFSCALGYGFLERNDGLNVLCYFSAVLNPGYKVLLPGEAVEFEMVRGTHGYCAANVLRIEKTKRAEHKPLPTACAQPSLSARTSIAKWFAGRRRAKVPPPQPSIPINSLKYVNGDSTANLSAWGVSVRALPDRTVVSLDLSPNEDQRTAPYCSFFDANELKKKLDRLNYLQLRRDLCVGIGLDEALSQADSKTMELEMRFSDGLVHTMPARLVAGKGSIWLYAADVPSAPHPSVHRR